MWGELNRELKASNRAVATVAGTRAVSISVANVKSVYSLAANQQRKLRPLLHQDQKRDISHGFRYSSDSSESNRREA